MDQQQCNHRRVVIYSYIEEDSVRRVCDDCGATLAPSTCDQIAGAVDRTVAKALGRQGGSSFADSNVVSIRNDGAAVALTVPANVPAEVLVLMSDGLGGYRGVWSIKEGDWHPIHPALQRQLSSLLAPQVDQSPGQCQRRCCG